ncbi:SubName: Full=Related to aquaporin {ECO:0000313/EMBL:CCA75077.1}; Flags: Fragment [Serendipita indica DSM 11827]|nr:SubName: Full=Related to aquaporin {ECO:0000313/EMBL:CCA75077.1}; Flags: Fragment [Serendipita indica DSM 11827]
MALLRHWASHPRLNEDLRAASIELIGTTVFLLLALGAIQSAKLSVVATQGLQVAEYGPHSIDHNVYISAAAGVALLGSAWMFYRTTGGLFNPSVSLALRLIGQISTRRFVFYVVAQLIGAVVASALILGLTPGPLLVKNKLGEGVNMVQGLFIEVICTAILLLSILMLAAEKITFTGASLNPARSFGPSVVAGFGKEHWIYWIGPLLGSCLSVAFYAWLKHTRYWTINPNQMETQHKYSPEDPINEVERGVRDDEAKSGAKRHHGAPDAVGHGVAPRKGDEMI